MAVSPIPLIIYEKPDLFYLGAGLLFVGMASEILAAAALLVSPCAIAKRISVTALDAVYETEDNQTTPKEQKDESLSLTKQYKRAITLETISDALISFKKQ